MIETGDRVQARKGELPSITVSEFDVTGIAGSIYSGASIGDIDTANGWTVELIRKALTNLHLPETVAEIQVTVQTDPSTPRILIGKGDVWRDELGVQVPVDQIIAWQPREVAAVVELPAEPAELTDTVTKSADS